MTVATARRYRHLFELSTKTTNLLHLKIPQSALYLVATPSTPDHIRDDIMRRAEAGEEFSFDDVATKIAAAKTFIKVQVEPAQPENVVPLSKAREDRGVAELDRAAQAKWQHIQSMMNEPLPKRGHMEISVDRMIIHNAVDTVLSREDAFALTDDETLLRPFLAIIRLLPLVSREELVTVGNLIRDHLDGRPLVFERPPTARGDR